MKIKKYAVTVIFLLIIAVSAVLYVVLPKESFSEKEKRYLSEFPRVNVKSVFNGDFEEDFEEYLSDHVPFRSAFVGLNSYYNYLIGNNGSNGIYLGSDGYLISKPVSRENSLEKNIKAVSDFSASLEDIPVMLAVAPSKGYIQRENLPGNHMEYLDNEYFDKIKELSGSGISYIDLFSALEEQKNKTQLYYKTDHHWTAQASYIAYELICQASGKTPVGRDGYNIEVYNDFYGTSYSSSGYFLTNPDKLEIWKSGSTGSVSVEITEGADTKVYDSMFFYEHLDENDKYPVFLDGNHSFVRIKNNALKDGERLLVIKDSFAHSLVPLLADNFSEIVMVDLRYYKKPLSRLISDEGFDRVLFMYGLDTIAESNDIILE